MNFILIDETYIRTDQVVGGKIEEGYDHWLCKIFHKPIIENRREITFMCESRERAQDKLNTILSKVANNHFEMII